MLALYLRLLPMMSKYRLTVTISLCIIPLIALWLVLTRPRQTHLPQRRHALQLPRGNMVLH